MQLLRQSLFPLLCLWYISSWIQLIGICAIAHNANRCLEVSAADIEPKWPNRKPGQLICNPWLLSVIACGKPQDWLHWAKAVYPHNHFIGQNSVRQNEGRKTNQAVIKLHPLVIYRVIVCPVQYLAAQHWAIICPLTVLSNCPCFVMLFG